MPQTEITCTDQIGISVNYSGAVTIKYKKRGYQRPTTYTEHNEGTIALFTLLCRALAELPLTQYLPRKIMGYTGVSSSDLQEAFTQPIHYSSVPLLSRLGVASEISCDTVTYQFLIPINNLTQRSEPITYLKLLTESNQECAVLQLSEPIQTNISSNIYIQWKLKFSNATTN